MARCVFALVLLFTALGSFSPSGGPTPLAAQTEMDGDFSRLVFLSGGAQIFLPQEPRLFRSNFDPGWGVHGAVALHVRPDVRFRVMGDWGSNGRDPVIGGVDEFGQEFSQFVSEGDVKHLFLAAELQYFFLPPAPGMRPYLYLGPTLGRRTLEATLIQFEGEEEVFPTESAWGPGAKGGLGMEYMGMGLRLFGEAGYSRIWVEDDSWAVLPFRIGLVIPVAL